MFVNTAQLPNTLALHSSCKLTPNNVSVYSGTASVFRAGNLYKLASGCLCYVFGIAVSTCPEALPSTLCSPHVSLAFVLPRRHMSTSRPSRPSHSSGSPGLLRTRPTSRSMLAKSSQRTIRKRKCAGSLSWIAWLALWSWQPPTFATCTRPGADM